VKHIVMVVVLFGASLAQAQEATESPDGALVTKDTYPTQIVDRPLTLPKGMVSLTASEQVQFSQDPTVTPAWIVGVGAALGVTRNLELGLTGSANVGGVNDENQIGVYGVYQLMRNVGLRLFVNFDSTDSVSESSPTDTSTSSDTTTIESSNSQVITVEVGAPVKFKFPHVPLSIGGLDALADLYVPVSTATVSADYIFWVNLQVPVYVEYSPYRLLSFRARVAAQFPVGGQPAPQVDVKMQVDALYTRPHLDAGVSFQALLIDDLSTDATAGWQPTTFTCLATLTLRI
jgi:hypothetical protein